MRNWAWITVDASHLLIKNLGQQPYKIGRNTSTHLGLLGNRIPIKFFNRDAIILYFELRTTQHQRLTEEWR